ncbi:uncharacterized protein LOC135388688 [Ornithodoros turicata]|uniref:uncharacterized protein LOC135388688 n=1 Tax=Ornithodoros turicata TaxID=34597 RepID=UPI0031393181
MGEALLCLGFIFLFLIQESLRALYMWRQRRFTDGSPAEITPFNVGGSASNGPGYGSVAASTPGGDSRVLPTPVAFTYPVFYAEALVLLSLAIHLVLDGVAIAIQTTPHQTWMAFSQVAIVSYLSSFVIGTLLYTSDLHDTLSVIAGIIFSLLVTCGALVGLATRWVPGNLAHGVLDGLISGGLLYVIFFRVLQRSRHLFVPGLAQFALTGAGTITVGVVKLVVPVVF